MRRIVAAVAALLLLAAPAAARVAVVVHQAPNETTNLTQNRADHATAKQRALLYVTSFLDAFRADYDVIPARRAQTSIAKGGIITGFNGDTAYSGIIWVGGTNTGTNPVAGCFPCSLTISSNAGAMLPTVPQLFVPVSLAESGFNNATSCSTGAGGDAQDPDGQGPGYSTQRVWMPGHEGYKFGWVVGTQLSHTQNDKASGAVIKGGLRTLLGSSASNMVVISGGYDSKAALSRPAWRDSTYSPQDEADGIATGFTMQGPTKGYYLIERLNRFGTATTYAANPYAPTMYAHWLSSANPTTGGDGSNDLRVDGNPYPIWLGIAHMDSLANGWILGRGAEPRGVAVQVVGGLSRGAWNLSGGWRPSEPNAAKAVDSLASLGVPFAVGISTLADTVATYASDLDTWRRAPLAHFAVQTSGGLSGGAEAGVKGATCVKPVDLLGRYRSRLFYTTASCDTSIYKLLVAAKARRDSLVGSGRGDNMLIADDWSPFNYPRAANSRDSLAYAAHLAGFTGVTSNADDDSLDAVTPSNPIGMDAVQRAIPVGNGDRFLFTTFPGMDTHGAAYGHGGRTADYAGDSAWAQAYAHRSMRGLFLPSWFKDVKGRAWVKNDLALSIPWYAEPGTSGTISPLACTDTGTNILRISAASLGYGGNGPSADMPGFYTVKYFVNMCKVLNIAAGRTLVRFVYPDDLTPEDLRR